MENLLIIGTALIAVGVVFLLVSKYIRHRQELAEADNELVRQAASNPGLSKESLSDLAYMREHKLITPSEHNAAVRKKRQFVKREEPVPAPAPVVTTPTVTTSNTSVLSDLADIAIIANTVHHWNDNKVERSAEPERSVGVTTKESSWGFDDSDSRKSISSSMDTSSYSSSSSSSDSSSGPSSDW